MTALNFVKKFKQAALNRNCLRDVACPSCGSRDKFSILARSVFEMNDDGTSEFADVEYGTSSPTRCSACGRQGRLSSFIVFGLDSLLESRN